MKKFFGGGGGSGLPSSNNGEPNFHPQFQSNNSSQHNLAPPGQMPLMTPNSTSYPGSPHTPQHNQFSQHQQTNPQYFDLQPSRTLSPTPSSSAAMVLGTGTLAPVQNIAFAAPPPVTPGAVSQMADVSGSTTNMQAHTVDRNDLHKGLKALEGVLVSLDEYRDLKMKLAKCEKRLAKGVNELGKSRVMEDVPCQTLQASAMIFDSITDTTSKHAKLIQKEYEALNEHCARYFRRVAKEEKMHDELLDTLDSKVKKAHASHEKNVKKTGRGAIESHDKYISTVQSLTQDSWLPLSPSPHDQSLFLLRLKSRLGDLSLLSPSPPPPPEYPSLVWSRSPSIRH